jgi:2-keto-3-deoxy-L-fuconate dehydrogenase
MMSMAYPAASPLLINTCSRIAFVGVRQRALYSARVTAEEVAYAIASLASPLAASTTGTILRVDGATASLRV